MLQFQLLLVYRLFESTRRPASPFSSGNSPKKLKVFHEGTANRALAADARKTHNPMTEKRLAVRPEGCAACLPGAALAGRHMIGVL
jgi:hypothetical protein